MLKKYQLPFFFLAFLFFQVISMPSVGLEFTTQRPRVIYTGSLVPQSEEHVILRLAVMSWRPHVGCRD